MRKKVTSAVFAAILFCFFVLFLLPADKRAAEKEHLSELPEFTAKSVFSGSFSTLYEKYLSDNIAYRSDLVDLGTKIENIRGIQSKDGDKIVVLSDGKKLVLNNGKIMEVFRAKPELTDMYTKVLNRYSKAFSNKANLYLMLVPTQIEFDKSEYHEMASSAKDTIDTIYSSVKNFKPVDAYTKLNQHADEYIYFRTDHHWTQRGGYYGYQSIMEAKGEKPVPLEDMKLRKYKGFLGYIYNQANTDKYKKYADEVEYFLNDKNYKIDIKGVENGKTFKYQRNLYTHPAKGDPVTYGLFMDGDHPFTKIETKNKNGEVALVIKDSYANTVIPFLTNHYETILVIDPRSYHSTVTSLMKKYEIDDIIFINYIFTTTSEEYIKSLDDIR